MQTSSIVIVANLEAQQRIEQKFVVKPIILEDKIPDFQSHFVKIFENDRNREKKNIARNNEDERDVNSIVGCKDKEFRIVVPLSFAPDEPIEEIIRAAAETPNVTFYFTGNESMASRGILEKKSDNVIITGFLGDNDYQSLLASADGIMVLTTRDETLLAGAYESVSMEKALITSDKKPLRRYFTKGTLFIDNSPSQIKSAIDLLMKNQQVLRREMSLLKTEKERDWAVKFSQLLMSLGIRDN